jgi:GH25 family lysozyme M1 (1,4-beta-N-acetylmuramidase)
MYVSELENYVIWLAHYTDKTSYARRYDIWQYSSKGSVNGISGYVDMNLCYLNY